jgi:glutamate-1-semialdehyde 2,1-aminomutase
MKSEIKKYYDLTTKSRNLYNEALKLIPGANTRGVVFYNPYPVYAVKGKGSHIWDIDGNERIDYMLNASVLLLGHSHPKVISAIVNQLENGTVLGTPTDLEIKLAEKIIEVVPCVEKIRFSVTGTEACMNIVRIARAATRKRKIILVGGYYHGTSDLFFSLSSEGILDEVKEGLILIPFNDVEKLDQAIKVNKDEVAAVMFEPVLGSGGGIPATKEFLKSSRDFTEEHDILLIFDEVQTGFRLALGGAQERLGVIPDLVTLGKGITGGLPGSAYGGHEDIMDEVCKYPDTGNSVQSRPMVPSGGTHNAHPLSMAAGLAHISELNKSVFSRIDRVGGMIRDGLQKVSEDLGISLKTTGIGSFFSMYFTDKPIKNNSDANYADPHLRWYFDISLLNRGIYLAPGHCSYTCAANSDNDVKVTLEAMEQALTGMKPLIKEILPKLIL